MTQATETHYAVFTRYFDSKHIEYQLEEKGIWAKIPAGGQRLHSCEIAQLEKLLLISVPLAQFESKVGVEVLQLMPKLLTPASPHYAIVDDYVWWKGSLHLDRFDPTPELMEYVFQNIERDGHAFFELVALVLRMTPALLEYQLDTMPQVVM